VAASARCAATENAAWAELRTAAWALAACARARRRTNPRPSERRLRSSWAVICASPHCGRPSPGGCLLHHAGMTRVASTASLCPVPARQAVANDFDVPRIVDRHMDVHGGQCGDALPTRAPASWQTGAMVRSRGNAVMLRSRARLMWSMQLDELRTHRTRRGGSNCAGLAACASSAGARRGSVSRIGCGNISDVRKTVKAGAACGPACESSSARNAGDKSATCVSSVRSSQTWQALRCHPRRKSAGSSRRECGPGTLDMASFHDGTA